MDTFWESEGYEKPPERLLPKNALQRRVWELFEYADSSTAARFVIRRILQSTHPHCRCVAALSVAVIVLSIANFCLETVERYREYQHKESVNAFYIVEIACIAYFTFELIVRLCC